MYFSHGVKGHLEGEYHHRRFWGLKLTMAKLTAYPIVLGWSSKWLVWHVWLMTSTISICVSPRSIPTEQDPVTVSKFDVIPPQMMTARPSTISVNRNSSSTPAAPPPVATLPVAVPVPAVASAGGGGCGEPLKPRGFWAIFLGGGERCRFYCPKFEGCMASELSPDENHWWKIIIY